MKAYRSVFFEIVGYCNANCAYCQSGSNKIGRGKAIDVKTFRSAIERLIDKGLVDGRSTMYLFNWGEPFLHPDINSIIGVINEFNLKYAISTNGSVVPKIDGEFVKNLDNIIFSLSGFSDGSYKRVHGFEFERIKNNILDIKTKCRQAGYKKEMSAAYHLYKFNVGEMKSCEAFADRNGFIFNPCCAMINHWWLLNKYVGGGLSASERESIKNDLIFDEQVEDVMKRSPAGYRCPQFDFLTIDESANLVVCCQLARDHEEYRVGNILTDDIDTILKKRESCNVCRDCIRTGLAFYINQSLKSPEMYRPSMNQRIIFLRHVLKRIGRRLFWWRG